MNFYGADVDYDPDPENPFQYEARLQAEAMLEWAEKEARQGIIQWSDYNHMFDEAYEAEYQRLVEEAKAHYEAMTCECGYHLDDNDTEAGVFVCPKCGKGKDKVNWDDMIPF